MRRAFIVFLSLAAVLLLALVTLPWWMSWPLGIVGRHYGVTFDRLERSTNGRIVLHAVRYHGHGVDIEATRVDGDVNIWRIWKKRPARLGNWNVDRWRVVVSPSQTSSGEGGVRGWVDLRARLDRVVRGIGDWIGEARLGAGGVKWKTGEILLASAVWRNESLQVSGLRWKEVKANAGLTWPVDGPLAVQLNSEDGKWSMGIANREAREAEGWIRLREHEGTLSARFGEHGWLPENASLVARDWVLPAADLGLPSLFERVEGSLDLQLHDDGFSAGILATARPVAGAPNRLPELKADLLVAGNFQAFSLQRFSLTGPGIEAVLAAPVTVAQNGVLESPETDFRIAADLGKLPGLQMEGRVDGRAQVLRLADGKLHVKGRFGGANLHGKDWKISSSQFEAELSWPQLSIRSGEIHSPTWGALTVQGGYDFSAHRNLGGSVRGEVPPALLSRWIAPEFDCGPARFSATLEGSLEAPSHHGEFVIEQPRWGRVSAQSFKGAWQGVGGRLQDLNVSLEGKSGRVEASAELDRDGARLKSLKLFHDSEEQLSLAGPATIGWRNGWSLKDFALCGNAGSLSGEFSGGESGRVRVSVKDFADAWWSDFVSREVFHGRIGNLEIQGRWDHGPVTFVLEGRADLPLDEHRSAEIVVSASADEGGVVVSRCEVSAEGKVMGTLKGTLPVRLFAHPGWKVVSGSGQKLSLDIDVDRNAFFWKQVGELAGVLIEDPRIAIHVAGTWGAPRGKATVEVDRIAVPAREGRGSWPAIENLKAHFMGDGESITLQEFSAKIAGQPLKVAARLSLPSDWQGMAQSEWRRWVASHLEATLNLPETKVSALAALADRWIAPGGTLAIDVSLRPGMRWSGEMHVRGAASRPLFGPLGALQDVDADIQLDDRTLRIGRLQASSGGQLVLLSGEASHSAKEGWRMDLSLKGKNLPLVRQSGFLLRSDVDLRIRMGEKGDTVIAGAAVLRDSLFLTDLQSLVSTSSLRGSPLRRPPYFSIATEPFGRWKLDVDVEGDRFLRLKSPLFSGLASARFKLGGTLAEPTATGEAVIDEGRVTLPFATFLVEQGGVTLRASAPFDPYVSLEAASRRLGYDLRMEMTGLAARPNLVFTSSPPLDSEQILRLVMAGEAPQGETNYSTQQRALRLGAYLGQSLAGQLGGDAFQSGNFSLTVGERVSREGRETYALDLPLNDRWSLTGEYDEFDDYNIGVKWRAFRDRTPDVEETKQEIKEQEGGKDGPR